MAGRYPRVLPFYHSEKLQSTKTGSNASNEDNVFYHSEK